MEKKKGKQKMKPLKDELELVQIRLVPEKTLYSTEKINSPWQAVDLLADEIRDLDKEVLCVLNLDSTNRVINANMVSMGTLNQTIAEPREIFKSALLSNAAHIMLMHNHPSGDVTPSKADLSATSQLELCGNFLKIPVLDHIIVGGQTGYCFSFNREGLMHPGNLDVEKFRIMLEMEEHMPYMEENIKEAGGRTTFWQESDIKLETLSYETLETGEALEMDLE